MLKRTFAAVMTLVAMFCFTVAGEASASNNVLVYWYICGADDLETKNHKVTTNIAEMEHVKLPSNVKILILAGGVAKWHHPTLQAGGNGIYLYSSSRLEKVADFKPNMGDPATLEKFLKFGEDHFPVDRRIIVLSNHGGLGGVCYDHNFNGDGLTYSELKRAFASVYGNSPETKPFELVGFDACMTGSYELANSIADFSNFMLGSEPNSNGLDFKALFSALAKDTSINGAKLGKIICDRSMAMYIDWLNQGSFGPGNLRPYDNALSVIDLNKMPELRKAYEAYFDEALKRSDEEGFLGAFARAAEARNVDKFSNLYTDLGLLAKNTKSIMPKTSAGLLTAIDKAVVYNKRGEYLKSKGISTFYPYISKEKTDNPEQAINNANNRLKTVLNQNASYESQKVLYTKLLDVKDMSDLSGNNFVPLEINSNNHFVAQLTPEQMGKISSVYSVLIPVKENNNSELGGVDIGGSVLASADNLKVDWKKGIITEDFRAVEPLFDGHKIFMQPLTIGRGHSFYKVPVIYQDTKQDLIVRYDTSKNTYSVIGFGETVENGVVRSNSNRRKPMDGHVITPLQIIASDNTADAISILGSSNIPNTDKIFYWKLVKGTPFVYTRDATITNRPITKGNYFYFLFFGSPGGYGINSLPGAINIEHGKITRYDTSDLVAIAQMSENEQ